MIFSIEGFINFISLHSTLISTFFYENCNGDVKSRRGGVEVQRYEGIVLPRCGSARYSGLSIGSELSWFVIGKHKVDSYMQSRRCLTMCINFDITIQRYSDTIVS